MSDESDLTDTGQWARELHEDRRYGERRMDPHSLNRRLTDVERAQIAMAGDLSRAREDFAYVRAKLVSIAEMQAEQGRKLLRAQNFGAGVLSLMAVIVTAWSLFGGWIARQIAESMM